MNKRLCRWSGKLGEYEKEVAFIIKELQLLKEKKEVLYLYDSTVDGGKLYDIHDNHADGDIVLFTSGTTGAPKKIAINYEYALKSKKGTGTKDDKWLLTYAPTRWAGISVLLHVEKIGALDNLIVPYSFSPKHILEKFILTTHISLTPSLFRKLMLADTGQMSAARIKQLTFGGEYTTQKVLDDAKKIWPNAKITHIYASTEFGDICSASDGLEGFHKNKLNGWDYTLASNGELWLNGRGTGDLWEERQDRFYFLGRITEIINVGGAKVSQTTVENMVSSITGVSECRAYSITNALLGQVVGLDYVGSIEPRTLKAELLKLLPKYAVPIQIRRVNDIILTEAGKIDRR